jgi:hypothetical protein
MSISPSVMLQVEKAIYSALGGTGTPAAQCDRGNTGEYTADIMPAYNLALVEFANGYGNRGTDNDSLRVTATWGVFCYASASGGITAADALDPLLVWAHQKVGDQTWGGLATETEVKGCKLNWNEKDGQDTVEAMLTVEVEFDIARTDPATNYNA